MLFICRLHLIQVVSSDELINWATSSPMIVHSRSIFIGVFVMGAENACILKESA